MNWVGGSRTRVLVKQERRKQKEYFEKKRLKSKMKLLGVLSPVKNSTVSLDLLNLYMVNQISCQKKMPETVRKPTHVNMNRDIKMPLRRHDVELPMSPHCVPSNLCIDDIENNVCHQRLRSKEELKEQVQSSQVKYSYGIFESLFNRTENCSFTPPSLLAELSSNRNIIKQNFIPRIAQNPQKVAYEKKQNEQLNNVSYSNSLASKLNESQDALSPSYERAQFGTLFERSNSLGNKTFLTRRAAVVMDEDCGSIDERRQSDFIPEKKSLQRIWGENRKEISNEDVNQQIPSLLSENCDSFISKNMINLLNIDQQKIKKTFDKCDYDTMEGICTVISSDKNHFTDRCIRSIFTDPELNFSNSTFNKSSYPENCQPNKNCQNEYNNERNNFSTSFEKDHYPASSDKKGKFESDYQDKTPQKKIPQKKYSVNHTRNIPLEELHSKQSWDFGLGELDSSQSSQTTSYSPMPTDSCFSSSSEMPSEDEDQILHQIEDSNRTSIKIKETTNNVYLESMGSMGKLPCDRIIKNNARFHKQNENFHQFSMKNNTDESPQSPYNSACILQNTANNDCILQLTRCDAWVQTESESVIEEKLDIAIQCDIISKCKCGNMSFFDVEKCNENIKSDTTGGQEILKNS
uniref:Regulator of DNA class I crossover intermediates 1 n=1 Tax=Sus scrofa TaxID=9823 RepID=A0A5G2QK42_PIG